MPLNRRNALYVLSCALGWPALGQGARPKPAADERPKGGVGAESAEAPADSSLPPERVLGIGGLFFRSRDPKALAEWYRSHLGVTPSPTRVEDTSWHTQAGTTVFAPFPATTKYFGDSSKMWMINFRVRDLDKMAAQLRAAGVTVTIDPELYPNGRFAELHDPEGNPIQLWEPAGRDALPG